ncbi:MULTISPECIES: type II secretion system protein GspL [Gammaproteobacteria]|uniref:type II secretion system protein GspL n=1 Tax=Gammaproteobacteria TaxID=1236 RepID=UPI000DCFE80C|nr:MULTISPECIES: type II secretion system protein GspL [Gammaproteobacteria]RTE86197.1 type II secretion system protein GspL [Aliidiomarina sp. B3213]TCZ91549.1 type II secretion system protein GspL [Lysobacter sp. N42]
MSEVAVIRLPAEAEQAVFWHIENMQTHEIIASGQGNGLHSLPEVAEQIGNRAVFILGAVSAMSFHALELPAKSRRQAAQVIPFALEDEVSQDVSELHFSWPAASSPQAELPVAVIAKAQIKIWLDALKRAKLSYQGIYPDALALPLQEGTWSVAQFNNDWVVRKSLYEGLCVEPEWFAVSQSDPEELPSSIRAFGEVHWPTPPAPITDAEVELALSAMLNTLYNNPAQNINLLQGEFRQKEKKQTSLGVFKFPAFAASVCLVTYLVMQGASIWSMHREANAYQEITLSHYQRINASASQLPNNVRRLVDNELTRLSGGAAGGFLDLMNALTPAFSSVELSLNVLQFDQANQELRLQANGQDFQAFERFQAAVRNQQLEIEQGQLVNRGGQISGSMTIRGGAF